MLFFTTYGFLTHSHRYGVAAVGTVHKTYDKIYQVIFLLAFGEWWQLSEQAFLDIYIQMQISLNFEIAFMDLLYPPGNLALYIFEFGV